MPTLPNKNTRLRGYWLVVIIITVVDNDDALCL